MVAMAALLASLMLLALCASVHASMIAVDVGSENLKVTLITPGKVPISIVLNEFSKRKSPALVGFAGGERLLGEEAVSMAVRFPDTSIARARDLLGKAADCPTVQSMLQLHALPYKVAAHPLRPVAAAQVGEDLYSGEELVVRAGHAHATARLLHACKRSAAHGSGSTPLNACMHGLHATPPPSPPSPPPPLQPHYLHRAASSSTSSRSPRRTTKSGPSRT
jgi:hypothetical protein